MACYKPMDAWYSSEINESGKRSLVFSPKRALEPDQSILISCGQCVGCRLERSRQWAIRCIHEASLYEENSFLTLTWDDRYIIGGEIPPGWKPKEWKKYLLKKKDVRSIDMRDISLFMKRLRKKFPNKKMRYYACGEYGEKNKRPHYHLLLFNHYPKDAQLWKIQNGQRYYTSQTLSSVWPFGFVTVGDVTFQSAGYVARYIMKKVNGDLQDDHYNFKYVDEETGELLEQVQVEPETTTMSNRPGIASGWYDKYEGDVYPSDFISVEGKKLRVPKYYDSKLEKNDPELHEWIKDQRIIQGMIHSENQTPERLWTREAFKKRQIETLIREL